METQKLTEQLNEIEILMQKAKEIAQNLQATGNFTTDSISSRIYDRMLLVDEYVNFTKSQIIDNETI